MVQQRNLTRDLAAIKFRNESKYLKSDLYVYEVDVAQSLHFKQLFKNCLKYLVGVKKKIMLHLAHGRMRLPEGKMSTRKGNTIKLENLLNKAIEKSKAIINEKNQVDGEEMDELSKSIGIGAVKYNDLKRNLQTNYVFTFEEALNMDGNSSVYLQYTYVRGLSILDKSDKKISLFTNYDLNSKSQIDKYEKDLLRLIYQFPEVVELVTREFSPHYVCNYLFDLAQSFNTFYNSDKVIGSTNEGLKLLLVNATAQVIKNGLKLLGIETPNKM